MLFNSYSFILVFLPLSIAFFWKLPTPINTSYLPRYFILLIFSLLFYSFSGLSFLVLLLASISVNYLLSYLSIKSSSFQVKKLLLYTSSFLNLLCLFFYKYLFFILSLFLNPLPDYITNNPIILPLGISFFTFQQISFQVDCFKGYFKSASVFPGFWKYMLFVSFFPQLVAGPIVHYSFISKYINKNTHIFKVHIFMEGLVLFSIGLSKKVLLADTLIPLTSYFDNTSLSTELHPVPSLIAVIAYSLQLYFDFSGYCDMARGIAKFFGFDLPINFDSPYKSAGIQEFWRRWHITLGEFLRDYIYIPLGGSRLSLSSTYLNLLITFLIGGLWHGAGFTFIIWGFLHGLALVVQRLCSNLFIIPLRMLNNLFTFCFVSVAWIFFRSPDVLTALDVFKSLFNYNYYLPAFKDGLQIFLDIQCFDLKSTFSLVEYLVFLTVLLAIVFCAPNSSKIAQTSNRPIVASCSALLLVLSLSILNTNSTEFLYFNF